MNTKNRKPNNIVSVLLPARNEELTINKCVRIYNSHPRVGEVIVIANCCIDDTAHIARKNGAKVIEIEKEGKGNALMVGAKIASYPIVACIDSDTPNPQMSTITKLLKSSPSNKRLVKGTFNRTKHPGPVTDMLVKPILKNSKHPLASLTQPLSGVIACGTEWLRSLSISSGFGADLEILIFAHYMGLEIKEVNIKTFNHKKREWIHYLNMSNEITKVLLKFGMINYYSK